MATDATRSKDLLGLIIGPEQLSTYYAVHETADARSSNYDEMCRGMSRSEATETCARCDGTGLRLLTKTRMAEYARRIAASSNPSRVREHMEEEAHCADCEGRGVISVFLKFLEPDSMFNTIACPTCRGHSSEDCRQCGGESYVIPVTVRETGCSKKGRLPPSALALGDDYGSGGLALGDVSLAPTGATDIEELMRTGEAIRIVEQGCPRAADALGAYHGQEGARWAATKWGRLFAIWPLTNDGKRLAQEAGEAAQNGRNGSGFLLSPIERLASVRNQETDTNTPNIRWRALMRGADAEARDLLVTANRLLGIAQ